MIFLTPPPASHGHVLSEIDSIDNQPREEIEMRVTIELLPERPSMWSRVKHWIRRAFQP